MPPKRKPHPPSVGTRKGVYAHKVSKTGKVRRVYRKKNVQKLPRLKLTSNEKKRQRAALKKISPLTPLKKKLTKKSNLPKRKRSRSRSRSRSSSKSKSSSILSSLSSLLSN
jgi:hypothetical protein